jgi:hypothetical protein
VFVLTVSYGGGRVQQFSEAQIAFILRQAEEAFGSITAGQSIRGMTATAIVVVPLTCWCCLFTSGVRLRVTSC